jgi:hypothetical protein
MAAIVKANSHLTSGGLSVLRRSFTTSDDGQMTYAVEYMCLRQYAGRWTPSFKTGAEPPTPLPANMLLLDLTKTPTLLALETETTNELTYFRATYSAGVPTDVTITEASDTRNVSFPITYPVGYTVTVPFTLDGATSFVTTGQETLTASFDYISVSVTAEAKNTRLPKVQGYTGAIFNQVNTGNLIIGTNVQATTLETTSKTKTRRGEYTYSLTSTGVYVAGPVVRPIPRTIS